CRRCWRRRRDGWAVPARPEPFQRRRRQKLVHRVTPVDARHATLSGPGPGLYIPGQPSSECAWTQRRVFAVDSGALVEASDHLVMRAFVAGSEYGQEQWLHRLPPYVSDETRSTAPPT